MPFLDPLRVERVAGKRLWRTIGDREYHGETDQFTIPDGFMTDFASVPRLFRGWLFDSDGPWINAAILHDWLLTLVSAGLFSSRDADGIFRRAMREERVVLPARWALWAAVRLGALANPERAHQRQFLRDLPVIALMVLPALLLLPAVAGIAVTLTLLLPFRVFRLLHTP